MGGLVGGMMNRLVDRIREWWREGSRRKTVRTDEWVGLS